MRWRIGRQKNLSLRDDIPLKVLAQFEPEQEYVLEPGDMLYLPPGYAHDGIAEGECMTYSIGFRVPARAELANELLLRVSEDADEEAVPVLYRDAGQDAVELPAAIPERLHEFARDALKRALSEPLVLVMKKNSRTLANLIDWLEIRNRQAGARISSVPMLLIDDEADNASVNVSKNDDSPSAINDRIRKLLDSFDRNVYLGYTATPFANIFIDPDTNETVGAGLIK